MLLTTSSSSSSSFTSSTSSPLASSISNSSSIMGSENLMMISGCVTIALLSALYVVQRETKRRRQSSQVEPIQETKKIIDKTKYPGGQITIYYATQTGTAESFAEQLEREGADHGFFISVMDMEETLTLEQLLEPTAFQGNEDDSKTSRAIILAATYGEGEPTDNSAALVQLCKNTMQEQESATLLHGLEYCVFGLGNGQYEHYNAMGTFFDTSLESLGGHRIMDIGLGDDDADLEGDFEAWKDLLWKTLEKKYCQNVVLPTKSSNSTEFKLPPCEYAIEYHATSSMSEKTPTNVDVTHVHGSSKPFFTAVDCPVTVNKELQHVSSLPPQENGNGNIAPVHSTKHIEIDISKADWKYTTADNLGVLALNDAKVVESVASSLGYDLDAVFSLKPNSSTSGGQHEWHGAPFPMPLTVRDCLTRYLDLTSAPRRSDLKLLMQYATDKVDRQALLRLSSKEGKQEYKEKITQGYVGMVQLLKLCPSLTIPLEHFVSVCHFLLPRFYTIASSSSVHPTSVHLTVAVTQEQRPDGSVFHGVCSNHLSSSQAGKDVVRVFNRPSTFRLPNDPSRPILLIGPGTGIAPMRALLKERHYQKTILGKKVGPNVLYFGCKKRAVDYLYQEELEAWKAEGTVDALHLAFSRDQSPKVYVQHLLLQNAKETWDLIDNQQGSIYVCGGVKMGHDVTEALKEILVSQGEMSFDHAKDYLAKLSTGGRFVQELWA